MPDDTIIADPNVTTAPAETTTTDQSTPSSESWVRSWIKDDGALDPKAWEKAPDEFKPHAKYADKYKTFGEFFKANAERESLLGKKGLVDPLPENATDQEKTERAALLRKVNGAPDKPEGYGMVRPEGYPENLWDQKFAETVQQIAHKHGVSPSAMKELAAFDLTRAQQGIKAQQEAEKAWYDGQDKIIRENLQTNGMDFVKGKELAERAGRKWGIDPSNPVMKNASVFMLLTRLGKAGLEDNIVKGDTDEFGLNKGMTAEAAEKEADDIQRNKENPMYKAFHNASDPGHDEAKAKWLNLIKRASKDKTRGR